MFRMPLGRLPIFAFGICCGKLSRDKIKIKPAALVVLIVFAFAAFVAEDRWIPQPYAKVLYYPIRGLFGLSIIAAVVLIMEALCRIASRLYSVLFTAISWLGGLTLELYLLHQSWLILLNYPYRVPAYIAAAVLLPIVTAALIFLIRRACKKEGSK